MKHYKISKLCSNSTVSKFVTKEVSLSGRSDQVILAPIFREFFFYKKLYIVATYHCKQFHSKLMNQT